MTSKSHPCVREVFLLALACAGCTTPQVAAVKRNSVAWPGRGDASSVVQLDSPIDGEAALVSSAAIQEVIRSLGPGHPLFSKCPTPATALEARVGKWHGTYYVTVDARFDRCGGKRSPLLDWFESYAVAPDGRVIARREPGP